VDVVRRGFWFAAGAASGVYAMVKVRRVVEVFTPDGIGARVAAVKAGARQFADNVSEGAHQRESDLLAELRASATGPKQLETAPARQATARTAPPQIPIQPSIEEKVSSNGDR